MQSCRRGAVADRQHIAINIVLKVGTGTSDRDLWFKPRHCSDIIWAHAQRFCSHPVLNRLPSRVQVRCTLSAFMAVLLVRSCVRRKI
jgi:hypothetical protein